MHTSADILLRPSATPSLPSSPQVSQKKRQAHLSLPTSHSDINKAPRIRDSLLRTALGRLLLFLGLDLYLDHHSLALIPQVRHPSPPLPSTASQKELLSPQTAGAVLSR